MTNPSRLCPEHQAEYDRWLDYRLPPASVRIISIGTGARDAAAASRAARFPGTPWHKRDSASFERSTRARDADDGDRTRAARAGRPQSASASASASVAVVDRHRAASPAPATGNELPGSVMTTRRRARARNAAKADGRLREERTAHERGPQGAGVEA